MRAMRRSPVVFNVPIRKPETLLVRRSVGHYEGKGHAGRHPVHPTPSTVASQAVGPSLRKGERAVDGEGWMTRRYCDRDLYRQRSLAS